MKTYVLAKNTGKGFITHEDQKLDGLKFKIVSRDDNVSLIVLTGETDKLDLWIKRVGGFEISKEDADTFGKTQSNLSKNSRITEKQSELDRETNLVFDINDY